MFATEQPLLRSCEMVVVVSSLGGLASTSTLLGGLPEEFPVPLVLLQHGLLSHGSDPRADLLRRNCRVPVEMGGHQRPLAPRGATVVPTGYGATLDAGLLCLGPVPPGGGGDMLLASAAAAYGPRLVAVILTGLLADGSQGVRAVKRHGGRVLVEDPTTARAAGMPSNAIATGCVDFVLPVERIPAALVALTVAPGGAALLAVATPPWALL